MRQRLFGADMLAHHKLGGVAQFVAILARTGFLREMTRCLGDGGKTKAAGGADNVLGQPSGFFPFFRGAGVGEGVGELLGRGDVALQDIDQRLDPDRLLQGREGDHASIAAGNSGTLMPWPAWASSGSGTANWDNAL